MKTKKVFYVLMMVAAIVFAQSCSKNDGGSISETDLALAQDEAYVDALFEEVDNTVSYEVALLDANGYVNSGLKSTESDICRTISVDHPDFTSFPKIITIDYGDGCTVVFRDDTITRKGQIIVTLTDRWFVPGAEHIVTFNEFYINGTKIEGTRTITNLGLNDENHIETSIELVGGKITFEDATWMTRDASHMREWIRHFNPQNDTVIITGIANGTNVKGEEYQREITEPLVLVHCDEYKWRWVIVDGLVTITNSAAGVTTIDYSAEDCNGIVIINKNGFHHNYIFKYNHRHHYSGHR
jgi:hypothetical protein